MSSDVVFAPQFQLEGVGVKEKKKALTDLIEWGTGRGGSMRERGTDNCLLVRRGVQEKE